MKFHELSEMWPPGFNSCSGGWACVWCIDANLRWLAGARVAYALTLRRVRRRAQ